MATNKMIFINNDCTGCNTANVVDGGNTITFTTRDGIQFTTCVGRAEMLDPETYGCTVEAPNL